MRIEIIASGSKGNCYLVSDGTTNLLLDAGIPVKKIRERIPKMRSIDGVLITHRHEDHCKAARELCHCGIKVYAGQDVIRHKDLVLSPFADIVSPSIKQSGEAKPSVVIGSMMVLTFSLEHDVPNFGYYIYSTAARESLLYFTDTHFVRYRFPGVNYLMCECNYVNAVLEKNIASGLVSESLGNRIRNTHMSLENLLELLVANDFSKLKKVYLLHLSDMNSDEALIRDSIMKTTGCEVYIA